MEFSSEVNCANILEEMIRDSDKLSSTWNSVDDIKDTVHNLIKISYLKFLNMQLNAQQENTFKKSLFSSLENLIMTRLHDKIFNFISKKYQMEDEIIYKKCCYLSALKITPDQLGALEDYAIPLPATVVELASLDVHESPADKLTCLSTSFDLAMAELKGAMVDVIALNCDNKIPTLNISDVTPILATIVIHAKPMHLISNLFYVENFYWTEFSSNESECLLAFKTAVDKLKVVTTDVLLPRSTRIYCDIQLEDIFKLTSDVNNKFDRTGQRISSPNNPLERHIEHFTNLITASTLNNTQL